MKDKNLNTKYFERLLSLIIFIPPQNDQSTCKD